MSEKKLPVGGQAVIEGVMIRAPEVVSIAVRKPDGTIVVKREGFTSVTKKSKVLGLPILRGAVALIETIIIGVKALSFSGDVAMAEEKKQSNLEKRPRPVLAKLRLGFTLVVAFAVALAIFFYVPLILTEWMGIREGFLFNLVDGLLRLAIFLAYIFLIAMWKDIQRIFQYHGAEHKSIFAYENGRPLTIDEAKAYSTLHPRCGTSFLLIVMIVAMLVFMLLGRPDSVGERLLRLLLIPVIGGVSYELIKLSDKGYRHRFFRLFIVPGLWLQKITTKEPDTKQLEVALIALRGALGEPATAASPVTDEATTVR